MLQEYIYWVHGIYIEFFENCPLKNKMHTFFLRDEEDAPQLSLA